MPYRLAIALRIQRMLLYAILKKKASTFLFFSKKFQAAFQTVLYVSFVFLMNFFRNFRKPLFERYTFVTFSCYDNIVTGTHQYFIHNTLGGSKESPLPRIYRLLRMQEPFLFAILPQIYPISRKNHWKSHRPQAVTYFYIAYSIFFISLSVRS